MAEEIGNTSKATTSILDELMNDDTDQAEETPAAISEDDEEIVPDHEFKLNENESDEEETDEEESEEETEDKDEEEKEPDLEHESEVELAKIPKRQEIKAAYPDIFKKFPQLEHALFRDQAYTELFPTVNDAKEAKESIEQFNGFQGELLDGNIEGVLRSVKNADPKAFDKIAANFIDQLVKVDPNGHLHTTRKVSKGILNYIHTAATNTLKKNPDDKRAQQLQIASELIHESLFETTEVTPDTVQQVREDPERARFQQERQEFEKSRFTTAFNTVSSKVNNSLTNAVTKEIDTKNVMSPYVKSTVIKDVMAELDRQLVSDRPFKALIDKLWLKAKEANYADDALKNIDTALKNKARIILPGIMKAKKGEAMKGSSSVKTKEKRELSRNTSGNERTTPKESLTLNKRGDDKMTRRPGETKLQFLMRD